MAPAAMKRRWATAAVLAVLVAASALASPAGRETWANEAWRSLGNATAGDQADDDDRDPTIEEWLEAFGEVAADTGIRAALDADISFFDETSERLAEFFRDATVESLTPFLDSEQLLQQAARYADDPSIVTFLIASGFDPNKAFGPTIPAENQYHFRSGEQRAGPLHDAARYNANPGIVEALVEGGADVDAQGGMEMYTPLHYAARHNNAAVVSALIRSGARPNEANGLISPHWDTSPDVNGNAALHVAVCGRRFKSTSSAALPDDSAVIDVLVAAGADVQQANSSGTTPLHRAVMCGAAASVSALVRHGADANATVTPAEDGQAQPFVLRWEAQIHDCMGCNPIHLLVDSFGEYGPGSPARRLLSLLLDAGADINAKIAQHMYKGYSALGLAVEAEKGPEAVALLLESGAQVDPGSLRAVFEERFQYSGSYAGGFNFRDVVSEDNLRVLLLLIGKKGADANAADSCQRTALHLVASLADGEDRSLARAVESAVLSGADVNARTIEAKTILGDDGLHFACPHPGATPLHVAASRGATYVASALLDVRADLQAKDAEGRMPLDIAAELGHVDILNLFLRYAARYESPEMAALLIERGAEMDARDDIGWAPLHYALLGSTDRPGFQTANVLLEHGADANAATAAVGWTPLHLAAHLSGAFVSRNRDEPGGWNVYPRRHSPDVVDIVRKLIERGAGVGARTRVGGWTPARVAKASDEHRHYGLEAGAASKAVVAAIQGAGGKDEGCDDMPQLPVYIEGSEIASWEDMVRWPRTVVPPACEYNLPFPDVLPTVIAADGRSVAGSFTAPGADEALRFVNFGRYDGVVMIDLVSLRDESGAILPIMAFDRHLDYKGLCLDDETNTHTAVFRRSYGGNCCPEVDTMYYQYDAEAGNLVEVFVDHNAVAPPTGVDTACRWRDQKDARMRSGR